MQAKQFFFALLMLFSASSAHADAGLYLLDIVFFKPVGLVATVAGAGLLAGTSPLIALASISPPHDAFEIAAGILVVAPAQFTFARPVGVLDPYDGGQYGQ